MPPLTARAKDAAALLWSKVERSDTWQNTVNLLGTAFASLSWHRPTAAAWLGLDELDAIYVDDGIGRRIVTEPVDAAFRQGWHLSPPADMKAEQAQEEERVILDRLKAVAIPANLKTALYWGRLYGRGGLMLGTGDSTADQTAPLDDETVRSLDWTDVISCDEFSCAQVYTEGQMHGEPEIWLVTRFNAFESILVHESRIILTRGIPTSKKLRQENDWRDISVLQAPYEPLRNYNSATTGMAQMLTDASQAVMWIRQFAELMAGDQSVISTRLRVMELARALHIMPLDAGDAGGNGREDFQFVERTFSGVADTFDRLLGALASATGWPQTFLFGRSPAGENATGESDREIWDDLVKADQEDIIKPLLQRLVTIAAYAEGVTDPEGWTVEFEPLRQETDMERVTREGLIADTDVKLVQAGILDELTIAKHRYGGDEYDPTPPRLEQEDLDAMEALQEQDRERALNPPEPAPEFLAAQAAAKAGVPPQFQQQQAGEEPEDEDDQ
jgi:phage-related protein (TIGR01555 family)